MSCPIGNRLIFHNHCRAVVYSLSHGRSGSVDVLTKAQSTLNGKSGDEEWNFETELYTHMPLVDSGHCKIGEGVLRVIVEAHHVGLVLDCGVEGGSTEIVAAAAVLVVHICRHGLGCGEIRNQGVACTRREECPVEFRRIQEIARIDIDAVSAAEDVFCSGLHAADQEVNPFGAAVRCFIASICAQVHAVDDVVASV